MGENVSLVREGKERADVMYEEQLMRSDAWKNSDVLEISAKSEGKRSHGTRDYPRTTGNSRHPPAQVPQKGHGHAATRQGHATAGSLRTPGLGIKEDSWNQSGTHRLRALGITYRSIFPKIRITY